MSTAPQIRTALLENLRELHLPAMRDCFAFDNLTWPTCAHLIWPTLSQ
jgi:hypothetical protein